MGDFPVQIDTCIFNGVFILINIYQIVRLIIKKLPPKFNEIEEKCYNRDFKEVFSRDEFKLLLSKSKIDYLSTNESQICRIGGSFKEIIYIAQLNEGFSVELEDANGKLISRLKEGSWIGCIEYAKKDIIVKHKDLGKLIKDGSLELVWQVSGLLREYSIGNENENKLIEGKNNGDDSNVQLNQLIKTDENLKELKLFLRNRKKGCVVYRFNIEVSINN